MELPVGEFDLILSMGWLVVHRVSLDCATERVTLKIEEGKEIVMVCKHWDYLSNVISTLLVEKLVRKGCEAFLAYVHDISIVRSSIESIKIVKKISNVFPEELSRLSPDREVEVKEVDVYKTAVKTCYRLYDFLVMLFNLTNTSTAFMDLMNQIFQPYLD